MSSFNAPKVVVNPDSWGPTTLPIQFANIPYAPFAKNDRLGRCADFTANAAWQAKYTNRRKVDESQANSEFQYKIDSQESQSFQLVDTAKSSTKNPGFKRRAFQPNRRNQPLRRGQSTADATAGVNHRNQPQRNKYAKQRAQNWGSKSRNDRWNRVDRQASVKVQGDWKVVEEFDLSQLSKLVANPPITEDLMWCGYLDQYNEAYDKVTTKSERPLKRMENKEFYPVTTTDDPVIEKFAIEGAGNVFATDAILSHLMASPRSVYPWDIVVQKLPGGTLFFDKRDASQFDYLTVSETSNDPPVASEDDPDSINTPERLSLEATMINQNFSQQILKTTGETRKTYDMPNPFFDDEDADGMEPASVAYRYRKFTMGEIQLICRCEVHGIINKRGVSGTTEQLMTAYALNEWDGKESGGIEWRAKLDAQKGAVLATELKNNSCKLARWSAQSMIAGVEQMKIGYVSRANKKTAHEHVVLATQTFKPKDFGLQMNLTEQNMWGIIKMLIELMGKQEEGKYVILRDANKAVVRIYRVGLNEFEEEEEEEEEE